MCDYSIEHKAKEGETTDAAIGMQVVTSNFGQLGGTRGFSPEVGSKIAVCCRPGTEIAFENKIIAESNFGGHREFPSMTAIFRQIDLDKPFSHHDALELPTGQVILLTRLKGGQRARVLQVPAVGHVEPTEAPKTEVGVNDPASPFTFARMFARVRTMDRVG